MNDRAPTLEKVETLLENHTLPLLVQQRSGVRLLLHKSCRIPYVICQSLDRFGLPEEEYFLIPLSNQGFYGSVSHHDEPTEPFNTLAQTLQSATVENSMKILIDNVTLIRQVEKDSKKVIDKVLVPGETIHISKESKSCPTLDAANKPSLCCFRPVSTDTPDTIVCVREPTRHIHLYRDLESRFYRINHGHIEQMEPGVVYTIQDITQHQALPKVVCSISTKPTGRDEMQMPKIFRMVKIISDRVLIAYRLTETNHPHSDDVMELSSYYDELFAIAESSRVNMDNIRDHRVNMSIKRAIPGKTLSTSDFHEVVRRSSVLPPKLPERPATLRLRSPLGAPTDQTRPRSVTTRTPISREAVVANSYTVETARPRIRSTPELAGLNAKKLNFTGITTPNFGSSPAAQTVRLPTRDTSGRSLLKKFSSVSLRPDRKATSLRTVLDNYHNKRDNETNNNIENVRKSKPKKSLRGLEIVHILPDAQPDNFINLSKPEKYKTSSEQGSDSSISSSRSSEITDNDQIDSFIHNHYQFLDNQRDSSSHYSAQYSDESATRESAVSSSRTTVRFSDVLQETKDDPPSREIPSPDYDRTTSTADKPATSFQEEIRRRFSERQNGGLKSPTEDTATSQSTFPSTPPTADLHTSTPTNLVEELKIRFSNPALRPQEGLKSTSVTDTDAPRRSQSRNVFDSRVSRKSNNNNSQSENAREDPYLLPVKNIGKIRLTG